MAIDGNDHFGPMVDSKRCARCEAVPRLVRQMLDPRTGKIAQMFECKCNAYSWSQVRASV
jgi:hypothetical protein